MSKDMGFFNGFCLINKDGMVAAPISRGVLVTIEREGIFNFGTIYACIDAGSSLEIINTLSKAFNIDKDLIKDTDDITGLEQQNADYTVYAKVKTDNRYPIFKQCCIFNNLTKTALKTLDKAFNIILENESGRNFYHDEGFYTPNHGGNEIFNRRSL